MVVSRSLYYTWLSIRQNRSNSWRRYATVNMVKCDVRFEVIQSSDSFGLALGSRNRFTLHADDFAIHMISIHDQFPV